MMIYCGFLLSFLMQLMLKCAPRNFKLDILKLLWIGSKAFRLGVFPILPAIVAGRYAVIL
ncbi:hypothetical protein SAMN04515647_3788 [Cohaesibacter sp. ES.047]|nr:hypothetical protein SAMN04515647_3788 [Cohaesibacter sp. ES.047]